MLTVKVTRFPGMTLLGAIAIALSSCAVPHQIIQQQLNSLQLNSRLQIKVSPGQNLPSVW